MENKKNLIVVGGGAAGMMAAIIAARAGAAVTLIEHNEKLGKKLFITGKGRCNLTNMTNSEMHLSCVVSNPKFLLSAEKGFDASATVAFFEDLGLQVKVERGNRVFPVSDHSSDVIRALEYECKRLGVAIRLHTSAKEILTEPIDAPEPEAGKAETEKAENSVPDKYAKKSKKKKPVRNAKVVGIKTDKGEILETEGLILATGGVSYPLTGSDRSGLVMAEHTGHQVTDLYPALVPLLTDDPLVPPMAGLSLRNIKATVMQEKKVLYEEFGEMLFTHKGFSGPVILSASSFITSRLAKKGESLRLVVDLKPALTEEVLDKRLQRELESARTKQLKNMMSTLLPQSLIGCVLQKAGIDPDRKACDIKKE
ncbi:MAG: NAD(P)/FAD-dependent oxidoreductase, partial [Lachnospiraceae bacterium]|nr:NAD(P)/FAD-dependent oxidoreductase [Lachnospiraceae bacterium]